MSELKFREATKEDLIRLLELEQNIIDSERPYDQFIKEQVTYYDLSSLMSESDSFVMVAESDSEIVGCGYAQIRASRQCHTHDKHCYLGFIYLEPAYRGKSLGSGIIDTLKDWGLKQGMHHFRLDVYAQNEAAIRAYEKYGFNRVTMHMELIE